MLLFLFSFGFGLICLTLILMLINIIILLFVYDFDFRELSDMEFGTNLRKFEYVCKDCLPDKNKYTSIGGKKK